MASINISILLLTFITIVQTQNCPPEWKPYNNKCWYFATDTGIGPPRLSWHEAESYCQTFNGHLAVFETKDEERWVYRDNIRQFQDSKWWIGLNDINYEGNWEWIDNRITYDPSLEKWRVGEPNNDGDEDCVETWVFKPVYPARWNDRSCDSSNRYICSAPSGQSSSCPLDWTQMEGTQSCYKVMSDGQAWHDADIECKKQGSWLVSIQSQAEQTFIEGLFDNIDDTNFFLGYSDTAVPGTLNWVDPSAANNPYSNWKSSKPDPLPYFGSTCIRMIKNDKYRWSAVKCSQVNQFVCERGIIGSCPREWTLLNGKCYEIVTNPSRAVTWTDARFECQRLGADMLKIENNEDQTFFASILEAIRNEQTKEIWLGGSDIGSDGTFKWFDGSPIINTYWSAGYPNTPMNNEDDCLTIYTGKNINNWEHGNCFRRLPFICTVDEGTQLSPENHDHITIDGNCDEGWRHYNGHCYLFSNSTQTQEGAKQDCQINGAILTSILDENELSFLVGHSQITYWIGLEKVNANYEWIDGNSFSFNNWDSTAEKSKNCVKMTKSGDWKDAGCSGMQTYICKKDDNEGTEVIYPPTSVPGDYDKCGGNGWFSDPATTQCYLINSEVTRTWYDARYACQASGGDLASINSPNEQKFLQAVLSGVPRSADMWIGLIDANPFKNDILDLADSGWAWSDGSALPFINWATGEPNDASDEDCGEIYVSEGVWNDVDCYEFRHFVCEKRGREGSIVGDPDDFVECKSHEDCCFRHLGAEYGGTLSDDKIVASSEYDYYFRAARGRLNTPDDVVDFENFQIGKGHGGWKSASNDQEPWIQVDFPIYKTIKGVITQGRNGIGKITDSDWVTKFKVAYSEDAKRTGSDVTNWEFISDLEGNIITFNGNHDQNTQITNMFPREIVALHMRLYVLEYYDEPIMRMEYIGCSAACLNSLGMGSGIFLDSAIKASSETSGHEAKQARPNAVTGECLVNANDNGASYRGYISKTKSGIDCQPWSSQTPHSHSFTPEDYPNAGLFANRCRNPDGRGDGPWCYTSDPTIEWEPCTVPICPSYIPSGWVPSSPTNSWIQVGFGDYYKVNGITIFGSTTNYLQTYSIAFSDDGVTFRKYLNVANKEHILKGLDGTSAYYSDILREAVGTKFLRIYPKSSVGKLNMQFEVMGCYNGRRITCTDTAIEFPSDLEEDVQIDCPAACAQDLSAGTVYGGDPSYTENSAICPAAVHSGTLNDLHGGPVTYRKEIGQQSYTGSYQHNVISQDAGHTTKAITFEGKVYRCDTDNDWRMWKDHCYHLSPKGVKESWKNAKIACSEIGGDLISIETQGENDFIEALVAQGDRGGDVWIGLNDLDLQNYYQWTDGRPVTFTKWSFNEPNGGDERCVQFIRLEGYWNDLRCDKPLPYICKKPQQLLPKLDDSNLPVEEGCDPGWKAYESSCYSISDEELIYVYGQEVCEQQGGNMVSIHDDYEQAFVHSYVASSLPKGLNYTAWIGLAGRITESGKFAYTWESKEPNTYTKWNKEMPDTRFGCVFPFTRKGKTYYECTTENHPLRMKDTPWCSMTPEFKGFFMNCEDNSEYACAYLDHLTGFWNTDICAKNYYFICEKPRVGYEQPSYTTPDPSLSCASGWDGDSTTSYCYKIEETVYEDQRRSWSDAVSYCRSLGGDLASVHNEKEEKAIIKFVSSKNIFSYVYFWIGLNNINTGEGYEWSDASAYDYYNWNSGEPNNADGIENCVEGQFYDITIGWNDLNCDSKRNTICKIAKGITPSAPATDPPLLGYEDPRCSDTSYSWIRYKQEGNGVDKCYLFKDFDEMLTWNEANDLCRSFGGLLVSIHTDEESRMIRSRTSRSTSKSFWIGLRDSGSRVFKWADDSVLDYVNWASGEPNNYYDSEDCGNMYSDSGEWNDENCGANNYFICEKFMNSQSVTIPPTPPQSGYCPAGFTEFGNNCYMSSESVIMNWDNAREWCQSKGADLLAITNQYEQSWLYNFLWGDANNFWTGLTDRGVGYFIWIDGTDITYTNWQPGEPSSAEEGCVEMRIDSNQKGTWNDLPCENELPFACYVRKGPVAAPPATVSPIGCPAGFYTSENSKSCFKWMSQATSWDSARSSCQALGDGIDLASVQETFDNELLFSWFFQKDTVSAAWLGLQFELNDADARVKYTWSDGWPLTFTAWDVGQPSGSALQTGSGCVKINRNGLWQVISATDGATTCNTPLPYICKKNMGEIPPPAVDQGIGTCDPDWEYSFGSFCYYIEYGVRTEDTKSWYEASYSCQKRGAELASFHYKEDVDAFNTYMKGRTSHNLYIGLSSNGFEGWGWSDNSPVDYLNWQNGEPNGQNGEDCGEMYPWDGTWNDVPCSEKRGFICRRSKDYAQCSIGFSAREECGYAGIDEDQCVERRACCWDPTFIGGNISGCFYPKSGGINPSDNPDSSGGGISAGGVVGIVLAILIVLVLGLVVYKLTCSGTKSASSFTPSWTSKKKTTPTSNTSVGFDNPMALGNSSA